MSKTVSGINDPVGLDGVYQALAALAYGQAAVLVPGSTPARTVNALAALTNIHNFAGFVTNLDGVAAHGHAHLVSQGLCYALVYGEVAAGDRLIPAAGQSYCVVNNHVRRPVAIAQQAKTGATTSSVILVKALDPGSIMTAEFAVRASDLRVWDAPSTVAVAATAANDDLAVVYNTFLTANPSIETGDLKAAGATTRKVGFEFRVPDNYVAGQAITLRINAGMKTTVAGVTATVDAQVARKAAPTVDICATAAQSINSLDAANKDFVLTPTNVVPGDVLQAVLSVAVNDAATGTAVIGKIYSVELILPVAA